LNVVHKQINELIPYAKNARTHSDSQVAQIAASIREFGWMNPVLIDAENNIIAGHGRVLAARKLGLEEVPCVHMSDMSNSMQRNGAKDSLCEDCGTEFTSRKDISSKVCRRCGASRGGKAMLGRYRTPRTECKTCRALIPANKGYTYCSVECRKIGVRETRECKYCKGTFEVFKSALSEATNTSGNFCSRSCYERYLCRTDRVTGRGSQWNKTRKEVLRHFPFCALCGTTRNLQVHHIIPFRLTHDNSLKNLIPLCTKHHKVVESLLVSTEEFGFDEWGRAAWCGMLRQWQMATLMKIREIAHAEKRDMAD